MTVASPAFVVNASSRTLEGPRGEEELERLRALCPVALKGVYRDADPGRAARAALADGADALITLGGDGTARAAAQAIHESRADGHRSGRLVALPMGTANLLPRRLYSTRSSEDILGALTRLAPCALPGGTADGEVFLIAAASGFPTTLARARETVRNPSRPDRLRAALRRASAGLSEMFAPRLRFVIDGRADARLERASGLMVWVEENAAAFDAAAVNVQNLTELAGLALGALSERLRSDERLLVRAAQRVTKRSRTTIPAMIDGEPRNCGRRLTLEFHHALIPALRWPDEATGTAT